jgi:hypothetical protein
MRNRTLVVLAVAALAVLPGCAKKRAVEAPAQGGKVQPQRCSVCDGSGSVTCPSCKGTGEVKRASELLGWFKSTRTCEHCKGHGTVRCPSCSGIGYLKPASWSDSEWRTWTRRSKPLQPVPLWWVNASIEEALQHKRDGELREAEELLLDVIARMEARPPPALLREKLQVEVHWVLAWVYVDGGRDEEAAGHFRKVIELDTDPEKTREARDALDRLGGRG